MHYFSSGQFRSVLIQLIDDRNYPERCFEKLATIVYQSVNVAPFIFGFVIPCERLYSDVPGYFYCISSKIPDENRLIVSEGTFPDEMSCARELSALMRYFPLFGLSRRHLY